MDGERWGVPGASQPHPSPLSRAAASPQPSSSPLNLLTRRPEWKTWPFSHTRHHFVPINYIWGTQRLASSILPPSNFLFLVYANFPPFDISAFWKHLFTARNWARWLVKEFSRHIPLLRSPRGHPRIPVWHKTTNPTLPPNNSAQICIWNYLHKFCEPLQTNRVCIGSVLF